MLLRVLAWDGDATDCCCGRCIHHRFVAFTPSALDTEADANMFSVTQDALAQRIMDIFNANHADMTLAQAVFCVPLGTQIDLPGLDPSLNVKWRDSLRVIREAFAATTLGGAPINLAVHSYVPFVHGHHPIGNASASARVGH
jgi:hypothetical protein